MWMVRNGAWLAGTSLACAWVQVISRSQTLLFGQKRYERDRKQMLSVIRYRPFTLKLTTGPWEKGKGTEVCPGLGMVRAVVSVSHLMLAGRMETWLMSRQVAE